ncbi:Protein ORF73 [Cercospora zeina]
MKPSKPSSALANKPASSSTASSRTSTSASASTTRPSARPSLTAATGSTSATRRSAASSTTSTAPSSSATSRAAAAPARRTTTTTTTSNAAAAKRPSSSQGTKPTAPFTAGIRSSTTKPRSTPLSTTSPRTSTIPSGSSPASSRTSARPVSRDAIPEETTSGAQSVRSRAPTKSEGESEDRVGVTDDDDPPEPGLQASSPRKLEIRSLRSQAVSDAEIERRPAKLLVRHARAQSEDVGRPITAPVPKLSEREQGMREMEVMQTFLREAVARDALSAEIKDLQAEIGRLEEQNRQLTNKSAAATGLSTSDSSARQEAHEAELDKLRQAHAAETESLRQKLNTEIEILRTDLESHRRRSSRLEGVEVKIEAVEEALRESKERASQNEQELQQELIQKSQDRDSLAKVVEELKQEIDRCQMKLDEDSQAQAQKDAVAQTTLEQLRRELDEERQRSDAAADKAEKLSAELAENQERFRNELKEVQERSDQQTEELRAAAAEAEQASQRLRDEFAISRANDEAAAQRHASVLENSASTVKDLEADMKRIEEQHATQLKAHFDRVSEAHAAKSGLQDELDQLKQLREHEERQNRETMAKSEESLQELRKQVEELTGSADSGRNVTERLQSQILELQKMNEDLKVQHDEEVGQLRANIERLSTAVEEKTLTQIEREQRLEQQDKDSAATIESLQSKVAELQQQLEDVTSGNEAIKGEVAAAASRHAEELRNAKAMETEIRTQMESKEQELNQAIANLQARHQEQQQSANDADARASAEVTTLKETIEQLQNAVQVSQHDAEDVRNDRNRLARQVEEQEMLQSQLKTIEQQLAEAKARVSEHEVSQMQFEKVEQELAESKARLREHETLQSQLKALEQELAEGRARINEEVALQSQLKLRTVEQELAEAKARVSELSAAVSDTEALKVAVEQSLVATRTQLTTVEVALQQARQERADKEAELVEELQKTRQEYEQQVHDLKTAHDLAVKQLQSESEAGVSAAKHGALVQEKLRLEQRLGDMNLQHNRELEEEAQRHEDAYRELRASYKQLQETQQRSVERESEKVALVRQDLQSVINTLREEHNQAMADLYRIEEQSKQSEMVRHGLQNSLAEFKAEHEDAISEMAEVHAQRMLEAEAAHMAKMIDAEAGVASDREASLREQHEEALQRLNHEHMQKVQDMVEDHATRVAQVEAAAIREAGMAAEEQARHHQEALEALQAQHAVAIAEARAALEQQAREHESAIAAMRAESAERQANADHLGFDVDPSAQSSEDSEEDWDTSSVSHTPYEAHWTPAQEIERLQEDNTNLRLALQSARDDMELAKRNNMATATARIDTSHTGEREELSDNPFRSPTTTVNDETLSQISDSNVREDEVSPVGNLEGTLESLRIQTEQLLEINEDFIAEQHRWSSRLRLGIGARSSPLGAVS